MSTMTICYFVTALLILIPVLNTCLNEGGCFCFVKFLLFLYLAGKFTVLIIMLVHVQNAYYKSWEENLCKDLESFTLFWLIWNYIMLSLSFIYFLTYIVGACDDSYDEYDYDRDY